MPIEFNFLIQPLLIKTKAARFFKSWLLYIIWYDEIFIGGVFTTIRTNHGRNSLMKMILSSSYREMGLLPYMLLDEVLKVVR
ncbi:hypothetical protein ASU31_18840 [Pedobacter ginsenosidimutans]|uniref:Uncharacterized protein n=1 Tax=Pedobacter ginsenosidimutans TaxID=687842 RepID=A0A0T5VL85_9SPHI|nr:hypothetical protein ASU31_18840 [Pedobacter ginsenosidimutans]